MARARKPKAPPKRHPSERYRGPNLRVERWTNAKAALIGCLLGGGHNSIEVSRILRDGTSAATIRRMRRLWRLPAEGGMKIRLTPYETSRLKLKAEKHGLTAAEMARRILVTVARDSFDLYLSITDGEFDK